MAITQDGNSLVIDNCTITISNAFDPSTGVCTITITPAGGLGTIPGLVAGQPGLPPQFRNITLNQVPSGQNLPDQAAVWSLVSPGGPGVASVYDLTLYLNEGAEGPAATPGPLTGLSDVSGSPPDLGTVIWNDVTGAFNFVAQLVSSLFTPAASSTSGNAFTRTLATATVPAQSNPWIPIPWGQTIINGTSNTTVNLTANLGSTTGPVVGQGFGVAAAAAQGVPTYLIPSIPGGSAGLTAATVPAGQAATIYLVGTQVNQASTDPWATDENTTTFSVNTMPVLQL